jgi:Aluminium induced protein
MSIAELKSALTEPLSLQESFQSTTASVAASPDVGIASYSFDAGTVACYFAGSIENRDEMREMYNLPCGNYDSAKEEHNNAQLLLDLYLAGWNDCYCDNSDQPATALSALSGEFSFAVVDTSNARAVLLSRSSNTAPGMWWGTAAGGTLLVSLSPHALEGLCERPAGTGAAPFPGGSYFLGSDSGSDPASGQLVAFRRPILRRGVHTVTRVNSHGALCGLGWVRRVWAPARWSFAC